MNNDVMFSSATDKWSTPDDLFRLLDSEFHFTLDVCADSSNNKCRRYFTQEQDGLVQDWTQDICWMNPPYGREIGKWMKKAVESMRGGACIVCLIPSRTDTAWWHDYVMRYATGIRFIRGRLKFGDSAAAAPFPSAIIVFDGRPKRWYSIR